VIQASRLMCLGAFLCIGSSVLAQPVRGSALGPGESYVWSIRASHSDELLIAAGDSVDVVLLRDRCGADAGHGLKGCWDASTVHAAPQWTVSAGRVARVRALATGAWRFGPGTAGARIYAMRPGVATVAARLPDGQRISDSVWVIAAPGAVRILLEPKPTSIVPGDTVHLRLTARDAANHVVATVPLSHSWDLVGPPDSAGYSAVTFPAGMGDSWFVARLGGLTDSLWLHFAPRPRP